MGGEVAWTSSRSIQRFRIEVAEFNSGIVGGEVPIDTDAVAVAAVCPDAYELAHFPSSRDAAI